MRERGDERRKGKYISLRDISIRVNSIGRHFSTLGVSPSYHRRRAIDRIDRIDLFISLLLENQRHDMREVLKGRLLSVFRGCHRRRCHVSSSQRAKITLNYPLLKTTARLIRRLSFEYLPSNRVDVLYNPPHCALKHVYELTVHDLTI